MTLFGLLSVWFLMFGFVQSKLSFEDWLLSDADVKNLFQRLDALEASLEVEKQRNNELENTVNILKSNLENTKQTFKDKYAALEKQFLKRLDEGRKSCKSVVEKTQKKKTYQNDWQRKLTTDWWASSDSSIMSKHQRNRGFQREQKRLLVQPSQVPPMTVAFYAQMSTAIPESEATGNHVMVFDIVRTNDGNGYHPSTGVFIVPESGIYVFSWSFRNGDNKYHSTQLMVNSNEGGLIQVRTGNGSSVTGTGVAVLHVNKGDDVYVKIATVDHLGSIYSDKFGRSSFTGWKLN